MEALEFIVGLVNFLCAIIVLIKLFSDKGIFKGILGIICVLYAFIWGWQNTHLSLSIGRFKINLRTVMPIWTITVLLNIAFRIIANL